jgi:ribosomal protein S18 acetylase RimI-like enzyme
MTTNLPCQFRHADAGDVDAALPLIYSSGPQAFSYGFQRCGKSSHDFLRFAFMDGNGFLGHKNHTVATRNGQVVGIVAAYNLSSYVRLTLGHFWQLWRFYPTSGLIGLITLGVRLQSIMPPPDQTTHYVAHFGVTEALRGSGIGRSLLTYQYKKAQELGRTIYALDVSVENPHAQSLYESFGFSVTAENEFSGPRGTVPNTRRMAMPVPAAQATGCQPRP